MVYISRIVFIFKCETMIYFPFVHSNCSILLVFMSALLESGLYLGPRLFSDSSFIVDLLKGHSNLPAKPDS